ncbi:hypothetical protein L914_21163, partial [Phytophthora nicotianae]
MLSQEDVSVHVTWLNKTAERRYEIAYDEQVDVGSILCHVYLRELSATALELTPKSLARVQRCLARTKAKLAGEEVPDDDDDPEDNERPPPSLVTTRKRRSGEEDTKTSTGRGKGKSQKLSKREMAMHIAPLRTTVDETKYEDRELLGSQPFESFNGDVYSANREVVRAVLTRNIKLLKKLTTDADVYAELSTFDAPRSADVSRTALHYAIDNNDLAAAALLRQTDEKVDKEKLAAAPEVALPSVLTEQPVTKYTSYHRIESNWGNDALLGDISGIGTRILSPIDYFWGCRSASVEMLALLYPTSDWGENHSIWTHVRCAARCGNFRLVRKVVETLEENGGCGFNELHHKVLAAGPAEGDGPLLPPFGSAMAIKQAHQTRLRPLHLAAINPNARYLKVLWAVIGDEFSEVKDSQGYEAIHYAAGCESPAPMQFLLEQRCSMFGRTKGRLTPLMCALEARREENALALLRFAAENFDQDIADQLVSMKGPEGKQAVHFAAMNGCAEVLTYLLTECGDVVKVNARSGGTTKATALALAAQNGHLECVRILLANGARVDFGDDFQKTPLILAVKNGHTRIAAELINSGANVNAYDSSENSVAHYAASYGWHSCLQLLFDVGAELRAQNSQGFTALTCALLKQRRVCGEFLLNQVSADEQGKLLDFRDRHGRTMLFLQCQHATNLEPISYLLEKGLDPNISNSDGEYPLQQLIKRACDTSGGLNNGSGFYTEAIGLLIEHGAHLQYDLFQQGTAAAERIVMQPLQQAVVGRQVEIVDLLLDQESINVNAQASDGPDAWMTAASLGAGTGDVYLSKLLTHHVKTTQNGPLLLDTRLQSSGENFFHFIAHHEAAKLSAVPKIIRQICERCPTTEAMMRERDSSGFSPLMRLLDPKHERGVLSAKHEADPNMVQLMRDIDLRVTELFKLYLEFTSSRESYVRFMRADQVWKTTEILSDNTTSVFLDGKGDQSAAPVEIEYETVLHQLTKGKLMCEPKLSWMQWYGPNLVEILIDKRPEHFTKKGGTASLVDFVDLRTFRTALHFVVEKGDLQTAKLLLARFGADPNISPIRCAFCRASAINDAIEQAGGTPKASSADEACKGTCGTKELVRPALLEAVKKKMTTMVHSLLDHGARTDCVSATKRETPLHVALRLNNSRLVYDLLLHGASLLAQDTRGYTPLHAAVIARHVIPAREVHSGKVAYAVVTMITSSSSENTGFSVELKRRNEEQHGSAPVGKSGVLVALEDPYAASAVLLCDHKNRSPIHFAARYRNLELLRALLKSAGPTAAKLAVTQPDCMGRTPLHYAVNSAAVNAEASFNIEQLLLDHGAKANTADTLGSSPLHLALLKVSLDTFKNTSNLLDNAEDAASNSENKKRQSLQPRRIPSEESDPVETVSNLVADPGVDILAVDSMGHTPLHLAAATGAFVCVSTLLSALGDLDTQKKAMDMQDMNGFTPLGLAVRHKRLTVIMTLLRSGSEVNGKLRVEFASTASRDATSKENGEMEQARTLKFRTYFYHAVMHGLTGVCHMLLSAKFPRRQAIEDAIRCGQLQLANNLLGVLHAGGDGGLETLKQPNEKGETLLHSFAKSAQIGFNPLAQKFAWVLIDAGVSVDAKDRKGNIALHYAAKRGNTQLMDFLHHQSSGQGTENSVNERGETPLLFTLKQIHRAGGLAEDALLAIFCYFMDHPLFSIDGNVVDASGMNALSAFLDRFMESLALSKPSVFFTWIEKLLKRGVSPNVCFQSLRGASLVRKISNDVESWEPRVATMLVKGDEDKIPLLVRVAFTPEAFMRYHTLALLLRYGADLSAADGKGNTLLMHLAARNMFTETRLALGLVRSVSDPKDKTRECSLHVPEASVKAALAKRNTKGLTACHMAVQPLDYGSYENTRLLETLVRAGGDLYVKDSTGKTVIDYALAQRSRLVIRFLERTFPDIVSVHGEVTESTTVFAAVPAYSDDASAYLAECETSGQISRSLVVTRVDDNYDYSGDSRVHCENDGEGTELDALLTKVRAKSGLSVFFRLQLIHDEVEDVYLLFTNWGRIGETGQFRKTPFRDETEAINDFKKIFQSKTGNSWESRAPGEFVKKHKKYNLVQRVSHLTKVDDEVTRSFREDMESGASKGVVFPEPRDPDLMSSPSVMVMLAAVTDVRNLKHVAHTSCGFAGGNLLLAKQDDIRVALRNLAEIRGVLEEKEELVKEINTAKDDVSDEGATKRALLSTRHDALIEKLSERSCRYYEVMPCQEDALATSIKAFDQVSDVHLEMTRLRMLSYSMEMHKMLLGAKRLQHVQHPLEYHYHALQVRLAPLQPADPERQLIHRYFFGGLRSSDRRQYRISNVFEVE